MATGPEGSTGGTSVHATALVIREQGLLLRGPSGAGKSGLAALLLLEASRRSLFARLVGDDRVLLSTRSGLVIVRPHPAIAGLMERRGFGIVPVPFEAACVLRLIVDVQPVEHPLPRVPDESERLALIDGINLPCLTVPGSAGLLTCEPIFDRLATL